VIAPTPRTFRLGLALAALLGLMHAVPADAATLTVDTLTDDAALVGCDEATANLVQAHARAVAASTDDAPFVAGNEVRGTAQAFVALVTADALVLPPLRGEVLPSTTRTACAGWCAEQRRAVIERPIALDELRRGALIYGNALLGLVLGVAAGGPVVPLPAWFDPPAIERRLTE
jgi:branched-subunit amino acid aminotransferase/4-amino-4-deoxychorismate lyase